MKKKERYRLIEAIACKSIAKWGKDLGVMGAFSYRGGGERGGGKEEEKACLQCALWGRSPSRAWGT